MAEITIYHNPACGTSRGALRAIRDAGHEPRVVEYLKVGWTREQLRDLFLLAGVTPRGALRTKDGRAEALGLTAADVPDDRILDAMVAEPALVERPFVLSDKGGALCRPADRVAALL